MADEVRPRAVSGEIMTEPAGPASVSASDAPPDAPRGRPAPEDGIIDADYISYPAGSAPERPPTGNPAAARRGESRLSGAEIGSASAPTGGMDMLRREPAQPRGGARRAGPLFWTFGVVLALAAFWIAGGHALVRDVPGATASQPRSALRISSVTSRVEESGARPILFVDGEAANDGTAVAHLPALEIAVTGNDGLVTRYRLGTAGRPLGPGETFAFSSRLDAPKNGVRIVSVTFAE